MIFYNTPQGRKHAERLRYWRFNPPGPHQIVRDKEKLDELRALHYDVDQWEYTRDFLETADGRTEPVETVCQKILASDNPVDHFDEFKAALNYMAGNTDEMPAF
jgi:hypothetical protein